MIDDARDKGPEAAGATGTKRTVRDRVVGLIQPAIDTFKGRRIASPFEYLGGSRLDKSTVFEGEGRGGAASGVWEHEFLAGELRFMHEAKAAIASDESQPTELRRFAGESAQRYGNAARRVEASASGDEAGYAVPLTGLALSGGGIRSASYALGVTQRLAKAGMLKHFDYMSSVSGGGFLATSLSWWWSGLAYSGIAQRPADWASPDHHPYGTTTPDAPPQEEAAQLTFLRQSGAYLTPGNGITVLSGLVVVLRAITLNLIVWLPILTIGMLMLTLTGMWWQGNFCSNASVIDDACAVGGAGYTFLIHAAFTIFGAVLLASIGYSLQTVLPLSAVHDDTDVPEGGLLHKWQARAKGTFWRNLIAAMLQLFLLLAGLIAVLGFAILVALAVRQAPDLTAYGLPENWAWLEALKRPEWMNGASFRALMWGLPLLVIALLFIAMGNGYSKPLAIVAILAVAIFFALDIFDDAFFIVLVGVFGFLLVRLLMPHFLRLLKQPDMSLRYSFRRMFETDFGPYLAVAAAFLAIGTLPDVYGALRDTLPGAGGAGAAGIAAGIASALWGVFKTAVRNGGRWAAIAMRAGAVAFLYGVLLVAYAAQGLIQLQECASSLQAALGAIDPLVWAVFAGAVVIGLAVNLNYIVLGRFYRDRLMEAFMPDFATVDANEAGPAKRADRTRILDLWGGNGADTNGGRRTGMARGPFQIVNTNMVLENSSRRKYRVRGGDNFTFTPFACGSNATGWVPTASFHDGNLTLPTAMAVSGAAANPRTGPGGKGLTRSRSISAVMTLLNLRLGYWFKNPTQDRPNLLYRTPNHFIPSGYYSVPGVGYREDSAYLELTDGGHFENLALYELVRRCCRFIVICDGAQDRDAAYGDLVSFLRRANEDFGASVKFEDGAGPELLVARPKKQAYPRDVEYAAQGYFAARVDYGERGRQLGVPEGVIVYMKTAMLDHLSMVVKGYKGANPDFPDQSTGDQFFDEEQFEAYRELGFCTADQMVRDLFGNDPVEREDMAEFDIADFLDRAKTKALARMKKA